MTDIDLKALSRSAPKHHKIEELKRLPILWVLEQAGVEYEEIGGVYKAQSPFRYDEHPSFDIYGEHLERWGDFAEGTSGDVLDLLGRFIAAHTGTTPTLGEIKIEAARLLEQFDASDWSGPTQGPERKTFDLDAAREYVTEAFTADARPAVFALLDQRHDALHDVDAEWLIERFHLGWDGERIVIPYLDMNGAVVGFKTRRPGEAVFSAAGADYGNTLYGVWADDGQATVVLCEGESDVWSGTHAAPQGYVFLGLPSGAGSHPRQAHLLEARRVILAFDGDPAGRGATIRWAEALLQHKAEVLIAYVPDGEDLSTLHPDELCLIIESALPARPAPSDAPFELPGRVGYERWMGKDRTMQISDWVIEPEQLLVSDKGAVWDGVMWPQGRHVTLRAVDLANKSSIVKWAIAQGATWLGSDRDTQLLAALLHSKSTLLPRGRAVDVAGLHGEMVVYPGGRIGTSNYVYVPGKIEVPLENMVHVEASKTAVPYPSLPLSLRNLHDTAVMDPILAWLAVAPLRSRFSSFPILAVTGASGSGKTTLVREVVRHFTATEISANLTGTTKFAVLAYVGATNAFPVWFDEYRPGARKETIQEFNQLLRDAYTGQASIKGGMGDSWAAVREVAVRAPIIVSGEDAFSEQSHTERMVTVHLPKAGRNLDLMPHVAAAEITGFAADYLNWVRTAEIPPVLPEGPEDLPIRQRYNLGVLRVGWDLLQSYFFDNNIEAELGEPDWSLIIGEAEESAQTNPIRDALLWALEDQEMQAQHIVFRIDDNIHVRLVSFVAAVTRMGAIQLPGGVKAVGKFLKTQYGAVRGHTRFSRLGMETTVRTWYFPADELLVESDA